MLSGLDRGVIFAEGGKKGKVSMFYLTFVVLFHFNFPFSVRHNAKQLKLADFESSVLSNVWDAAQDILHQGWVTSLMEADKSFWTARVFDGQRSYEVEILLDGKRLKGFTCDCWIEHRNLMCKHVAAGAASLRQYLMQREMERRAQRAVKQPSSSDDKLNIATIIKRTPPEALAAFIQEYASEDNAFSTLLKSRFASWLSGDVNYYKQIIAGLIPEKHAGNLSPTEQRKVQRIVDDLVRQQKGAVAEHDTLKSWLIHCGLIEALPRLIGKMHEMYREPYHQIFQHAYLSVLRMSPEQLSPELSEQRRNFILSLIDHKFLNDSALRLLVQAMQDDQAFWEMIDEHFQAATLPLEMGLLTTYCAGLVRRKMGASIPDVIKHFVPDRDLNVRLTMQLYHLGHYKEALACGTMISEQNELSLLHKNTLGQLMLSCATKLGNTKLTLQLLQQRLVQSGNLDYYEEMKKAAGTSWEKRKAEFMRILVKNKEFRLVAAIHMHEQNMSELTNLLLLQNDFVLLHLIEKPLITHQAQVLKDVYVLLAKRYLDEHFGVPSAEFVRQHLFTLMKVGGADVARAVSVELSNSYPDRTALQDAFGELFPKHRKMIKPFLPR